MPRNVLRKVFTDDVVAQLCSVRSLTKDLKFRLSVLGVGGSHPIEPYRRKLLCDYRKRKAAWEAYLIAAFAVGLFDDEHGRDLLSRLRSKDDANFRSAMAECMSAWFLAGKRRLTVEPRPSGRPNHPLELCIRHAEGDIHVEVKAPYRLMVNSVYIGDGSGRLQDAVESANKQFGKEVPNLLIIAPVFFPTVFDMRSQITTAFFGDLAISIPFDKNAGQADGPPSHRFKPSGHFLETQRPGGKPFKPDRSPRFTRVSAVLCVEELEIPTQVIHRALVVHNPHAQHPISEDIWSGIPQFVQREGEMIWTDGADPWQ